MILFASAVATFPGDPRRAARRASRRDSGLVAANLARIVSWIGAWSRSTVESAHREVWPLLLIMLGLGWFPAWTRWARDGELGDAVA